MTQRWTDALAEGKEVRAVALDISKAFDKVWHDGLLYKLTSLGISGPLLALQLPFKSVSTSPNWPRKL